MIRIGELAKICRVNVQTLRYYDKIGLLCADRVDMDSGYRYYAPEKVRMYQTIVHLKSLDFAPEDVDDAVSFLKEYNYINENVNGVC